MDNDPLFLIEFLLFGGLAIGWGLWELWSLRRQEKGPPSEDLTRHPEG